MTSANHPMAWADEGACRGEDPDIFHPPYPPSSSHRWPETLMAPARAICTGCPVFTACHAWAVEHETEGIWAATDPKGRRRLRKAMGISDPSSVGGPRKHEELTGATPPPVGA